MPGNKVSPDIAILGEVDVRTWQGEDVLRLGIGTTVEISEDVDIFEDGVGFLTGYGSTSTRTLQSEITAAKTGAETWTIGLTQVDPQVSESQYDHIVITCTDSFEVDSGAFFGFTAGQVSTFISDSTSVYDTLHIVIATNDWTRGNVENEYITISPDGSAQFVFPYDSASSPPASLPYRAHSVPTMLRDRGSESDLDDVYATTCFEDLCQVALSDDRVNWGINDTGNVWFAYSSDVALTFSWEDTDFRDRLGFSGLETEQSNSNLRYREADNMMPGTMFPGRPKTRLDPTYTEETPRVRLTSGVIASNQVSNWKEWDLEFWLTGPAAETDLHRLWIENTLPYMAIGQRVNVYQEWGDPRRALWEYTRSSPDPYTTLWTSEKNGYRGRLRTRRSDRASDEQPVAWETVIRNRAPVSMRLTEMTDSN